jgi:2-polyprenyl-3-methyl-5-hydroxy-6-metoxy-1,4-benzoquinol methylase
VVRCAECSMCFANPIQAALLDGRYYHQAGADYYTSPAKLRGDFSPVRFRREMRWFRRYCPQGRVLDVGCNTGAFLHQLQALYPADYSVMGIDVSGPALNHAASLGLRVKALPLDHPELDETSFDAITFWAVLEHVGDPGLLLTQAAHRLINGGHIFVLVPNVQSLAIRLLGARYRYVLPEHINYFSALTLRLLARTVPSLRVMKVCSTHFNPVVIWQDATCSQKEVPSAERARLMLRTNDLKEKRGVVARLLQRAYACNEALLRGMGLADNLLMVLRKSDVDESREVFH